MDWEDVFLIFWFVGCDVFIIKIIVYFVYCENNKEFNFWGY